eukprot:CAMPEP_0184384394 /NCGR_PEP_ID=MMETSP0007-20130409/7861_1 /TAXON_ID=97485 /ORGANISM="Prymnesium parvum, Strain Texoma1" /LENGTH=207 /DNA_ID=CAMNT_0026731235 /DNA_START=236 /DNA_END=857 /DNA_ORIENTATION=+
MRRVKAAEQMRTCVDVLECATSTSMWRSIETFNIPPPTPVFTPCIERSTEWCCPPPPAVRALTSHAGAADVFDRLLARVDLLGVAIRNLNGELVLKGHDDLHRVEAIQPQVVEEMRGGRHFRRVDLLEVLQAAHDPLCDVRLVKKRRHEAALHRRSQGDHRRDRDALVRWEALRARERGERAPRHGQSPASSQSARQHSPLSSRKVR